MREMDTESPVVWPAWCYSAETGGEGDTPSIPLIPVSTHLSQSSIKPRSRRRDNAATTMTSPGDLTVASLVAATAKMSNGNLPDYASSHNNNNSVKSERLSPAGSHSATTPDNSSSRSRSVTPSSSSIPGTPPASATATGVTNIEHAAIAAASLSGRNYSDFMRSLAAKYNNSNPNEYFLNSTIRNGLIDPRGFIQNMKANSPYAPNNLLSSNTNNNKEIPHPPSDQMTPNNIKKLENLFNNPQNPLPLFPPMIDMTSTQALLAIVRQVKQDQQQQKTLKRNSSVMSPSASPNVVNTPPGTPLDLTSSTIVSKRAKLKVKQSESPELKPPPVAISVKTSPVIGGSSVPLVSGCCSTSTSPILCLGQCATNSVTEVQGWSVDDVVNFVANIDICQEYAESFREQRVDGAGLPLLTEDHLTNVMGMKLGPALKLKSLLMRKMGSCALCLHCSHCHSTSGSEDRQSVNNSSGSGFPTSPNNKRPNSNSP